MNIVQSIQTEDGQIIGRDVDTDWWRGAVIYQIYPRSFQDSNGDGIGDLKGITNRLDYVDSLGVDAIWLSPFFKSPMLDFGYDVSDYKAVDPIFGTLEDFDDLVSKAHQLGLKVMIDQVISHTSDQHAWFKESRASKTNEKSDWYVWADAQPDGSPPNNWLSIFGGPAWEWDTMRCQYYLHNFLASQPDLNFHNSDVQDALLETVRFWLERGVDGFRLDTINFYFHSAGLESNPAIAAEKRNASIAPAVNPYNYQEHLHDKNQPENLEFLKRFRNLLEEYPGAAAVGEVGDAERGLELVAEYTSGNDKVQMCYAFDFLSEELITPKRVREVVSAFEDAAPDGWSCWAFSNHDVARHGSRWGNHVDDREGFLKMAATLLLCLRGSVCLYQGEELGFGEADIPFEALQDPYGVRFWPEFKGRDGCRTPMVWNHNFQNGGFSDAKPWLPVSAEHVALAADKQHGSGDDSMLSHYRELLQFRRGQPALIKGSIGFIDAGDQVLMFERSHNDETLLIAINMGEEAVDVSLANENVQALKMPATDYRVEGSTLTLPAFGSFIARLSGQGGLDQ